MSDIKQANRRTNKGGDENRRVGRYGKWEHSVVCTGSGKPRCGKWGKESEVGAVRGGMGGGGSLRRLKSD